MECKAFLTERVHIIAVVAVVVVVVVGIEKNEESLVIISLGQKQHFLTRKNKLVKHGNEKARKQ